MFFFFQIAASNADEEGELSNVLSVHIPNTIQKPTGKVDFNL